MLISGQKGFVFAAASKNASTSIEDALVAVSDVALTRPVISKHWPVAVIRKRFSAFFDATAPYEDYFSFGIVRDPVKRVVSKFNYRSTFKKTHKLYCGDLSFDEFVDQLNRPTATPAAKVDLQAQFFGFDGDRAQVDMLLRVEHMNDDLTRLGDRLGADVIDKATTTRRNENDVKRVSSKDISDDAIAMIEKKFQRDIQFYTWVCDQAAAGWPDAMAKPQPDVSGADVAAAFGAHYPNEHAESLLNQIRLNRDLDPALREKMAQDVVALDPDRAADATRIMNRVQAAETAL